MKTATLLFAVLLGCTAAAQEVRVRKVTQVSMPASPDSNSPAFWRDGQLFWYGSHGSPWLSSGPNQFGPWQTSSASVPSPDNSPKWMEAIWPDDNGTIWGWYHAEPVDLIPGTTLTAPKVGASVSFDGGYTMQDLGFVLSSGEPLDVNAQNGFFAGGHGDPCVILDRQKKYFYIFFGNYGGPLETQGVCVARLAFADRFNPSGKVWKFYNGSFSEPGLGGKVTPIFPATKTWAAADPEAFWGPAIHWNTYLNCYVMLLNHASGLPAFAQEGVYVCFGTDLSRPDTWSQPQKILDRPDYDDPGAYYPQVMGLEAGTTDRIAGQTARLYLHGVSNWEIDFIAPQTAPSSVRAFGSTDNATTGDTVSFTVTAMGLPPFTYQWMKDGAAIANATASTYTIASATAADAGSYTVTVSNSLGTATSSTMSLSVTIPVVTTPPAAEKDPTPPPPPPPASFLSNLSVRAVLPADHPDLSLGYALRSDGLKPLILRAVGPTLAQFGVANVATDPNLEVFDGAGAKVADVDNWSASDAKIFAAAGAFPLAPNSADAAIVVPVPAGTGTAHIHATGGGAVLAEIYDPEATSTSKLVNASTRAYVGQGATLAAGFTISGNASKKLLVRAMGPQLAVYGVNDALANPVLEIYDNKGVKIAENSGWDASLASTFASVGAVALPANSRDAALIVTVPAGTSYTLSIRSGDDSLGEALLEIYELP